MHIPVGLIVVLVALYFLRSWWIERKRLRQIYRGMMMLRPNADPAEMRQYVIDVYGRR